MICVYCGNDKEVTDFISGSTCRQCSIKHDEDFRKRYGKKP